MHEPKNTHSNPTLTLSDSRYRELPKYEDLVKLNYANKQTQKEVSNLLKRYSSSPSQISRFRIMYIDRYNEKLKKEESKRVHYLSHFKYQNNNNNEQHSYDIITHQKILSPMTYKHLQTAGTVRNAATAHIGQVGKSYRNKTDAIQHQSTPQKTMSIITNTCEQENLEKRKQEQQKQKILKNFRIRSDREKGRQKIENFKLMKKENADKTRAERYFKLIQKQRTIQNLKESLRQEEIQALAQLETAICKHQNIKEKIIQELHMTSPLSQNRGNTTKYYRPKWNGEHGSLSRNETSWSRQ